ncbi:uncharacterized protein EAF01_005116 [Botrytis porri]|uniref:uncharacterized protein n=1 Tax=Botrytis porri TaxID=87229 RepID=UPI0019015E89|nr:uncharacterized protein EAF01_005116 [Botrytis porri]KAF7907530.1 hypothetical protein EAF01_005116 [Botrytis porri]
MTVTQFNGPNRKFSVRFNSTLNLPGSSIHGSDDDSASEQHCKHLIPSPASSATGNTLLVDDSNLNTVSWNSDWQQPTLMISMLSIGFLLSIGHHVFYNSLDGTIAGDLARQAWSLQVGAAFAFLAVICFRVAIVAALNQLIWKIVKDSALTMGTVLHIIISLPGLFMLTQWDLQVV